MDNVSYVLLGLSNERNTRALKAWTFDHLELVNQEKSMKFGLNFFCEDNPHITLIGDLVNQTSNDVYRGLKYANIEAWRNIRNAIAKNPYMILNELVIDTFNNEDSTVLKINCINSNFYDELKTLHSLLKKLPNEEKYDVYQPHLTLCYLKPNLGLETVNKCIDELKHVLQRIYHIDSIIMSDDKRQEDLIHF